MEILGIMGSMISINRRWTGTFLAFAFLTGIAFADRGKHHPSPSPSPSPTPSPPPSPSPTPISTVTLAWDANPVTGDPDTDAAGYDLWFGFAPGAEDTPIDAGTATVLTMQVTSGTTYYFVVTAYNAAGVESPDSNEVSYSVP